MSKLKNDTMKNILFFFFVVLLVTGCVTTAPQRTTTNTSTVALSPEAQARIQTEEMKTKLGLSTEQSEKVLIINTVHLRVIKKLKDSNETDKIPVTEANYKNQLKEVLTPSQYASFETTFN
jgi:hypothetical protein